MRRKTRYTHGSVPFMVGMTMLLLGRMGWAEASLQAAPDVQVREPHGEAGEPRQARGRKQRELEESEAENAFLQGPLILRNTKDGTIQVLDSDGHVLQTYPPGSLSLNKFNPIVLERMEAHRETQREWAKDHAEQRAQKREEEDLAAKEAAQKRKEAEKAREIAEEKAALEASAVRLQDLRTGEYIEAVPTWRLPKKDDSHRRSRTKSRDQPAAQAKGLRLYDRRKGVFVNARPLDQLLETVDADR